MNANLLEAVIANIQTSFPSARIFTERVVQGVLPDDFIINSVLDDLVIFRESIYNRRETIVQITVINPSSSEIKDTLMHSLKSFTINDATHYPDRISSEDSEGALHVFVEIAHLERS